jgi:hypothetical protein
MPEALQMHFCLGRFFDSSQTPELVSVLGFRRELGPQLQVITASSSRSSSIGRMAIPCGFFIKKRQRCFHYALTYPAVFSEPSLDLDRLIFWQLQGVGSAIVPISARRGSRAKMAT